MLQLRKQQDTTMVDKDKTLPLEEIPHSIGGQGCKRIVNIKKSNQLGFTLINNKMNEYKFNK